MSNERKRQDRPDTPNINRLYDIVCRLKGLLEDKEEEGMYAWHSHVHSLLDELSEFSSDSKGKKR